MQPHSSKGTHELSKPDRPLGLFSDGEGALTHALGPEGVGGQMDAVHGMGPGAIMFALAVPVVGSIGFAGLTSQPAVLLTTTFFAGFLVLGVQSGINVAGAMIYPTSLRSNGSGWQLGLGRIGSIVGPLVGAQLVGMPVQNLYMWSAVPFALGAVICFIVHRLNTARLDAYPELREAQ